MPTIESTKADDVVYLAVNSTAFGRKPMSPEDVARRELQEETGWKANRLTSLGSYHMAIGYTNEIIHCYLATDLEEVGANLDTDEFLEVLYMPLGDAMQMIDDGRITDAKSVVSLLRAEAKVH